MKVGQSFSRGAVLSLFILGLPVVVAMRVFVPRVLARTLTANALRTSDIILVGPNAAPEIARLSSELWAHGCRGLHTIEFDNSCGNSEWPAERQRMLQRILSAAHRAGPGDIYVVSSGVSQERVSSVLAGLRLVPRAIFVVPDEAVASLLRFVVRPIGQTVAIEIKKVPLSTRARGAKRAIDVGFASIALLFAAPFLALVALAIKLDSPGPIFFRQRRNGCRGQQFRIVKFRTMTVLEDGDVVTQATRNDHRVTRVGRWLRNSSIDELPQLWNVFCGHMSLVGPRPHAVAHDELYAKLIENYELRQHVKPGITGWAQVNGLRGETPTMDLMYRRIEFDLWYAANCSLALDLLILARTPFALMRQDIAY
jgi:Undecaprenyl-phosphate glucose phosphotransferase